MTTRETIAFLLAATFAIGAAACATEQVRATEILQARAPTSAPPELLSETGLYADIATGALGARVEPLESQGASADGSDVKRFIRLPQGQTVDTSDTGRWVFPVGTRMWQEIAVDGTRVETRMLTRISEFDWSFVSYAWRADQREADIMPLGLKNALNTAHDVPSVGGCYHCHGREHVLGLGPAPVASR